MGEKRLGRQCRPSQGIVYLEGSFGTLGKFSFLLHKQIAENVDFLSGKYTLFRALVVPYVVQ